MNSPLENGRRRRLRGKGMADELEISQRKLCQLRAMGCPVTTIAGLVWYEPNKVRAWLDKFSRAGKPGIRRMKGQKVADQKT